MPGMCCMLCSVCVCVCVCVCVHILSHSVMSNSLRPHGLYSSPGSSVHGLLQVRILEWVAIPSPGALPDPDPAGGFFIV